MIHERSASDRPRRELLCADLDWLDRGQGLWSGDEPACSSRFGGSESPDSSPDDLDDAVRAAVAGALTSKQREVVEAYFFEGISQGEIARRLGVTQQVVQKRLFGAPRGGRLVGGAIARLREVLAPLVLDS